MIINRKRIAKANIDLIKKGYSAFTESTEVAECIEKELASMDLKVHIDRTTLGCWFIPEPHKETDNQNVPISN